MFFIRDMKFCRWAEFVDCREKTGYNVFNLKETEKRNLATREVNDHYE